MSEFQEGRFWRADSAASHQHRRTAESRFSRCASGSLEEIVDCAYVNVQQLKGPALSATESYGNSNSRKQPDSKERSHVPTRT